MGVTYGEYRDRLGGTYRGLYDPAVREALRTVLGEGFLFTDALDALLDTLQKEQDAGKRLYRRFPKRMDPLLNADDVQAVLADEQHPKHGEVSKAVTGKLRQLAVPSPAMREFSDHYLVPFVGRMPVHSIAHGGCAAWTPRKSMEQHVPAQCALTFDVDSAFDNVKPEYVFDAYAQSLSRQGFADAQLRDTAGWLTMVSTVSRGHSRCLPTGAPHAMRLFNAIWYTIDDELESKARRRGYTVTRWVDDVIVSSKSDVAAEEMLGAVHIVERYFPISSAKTFFQSKRIFALGHIIEGSTITKNSNLQRIMERSLPVKAGGPLWDD